jgi:hypothetical protein
MAVINTLAVPAVVTPNLDVGVYPVRHTYSVPASGIASGDLVRLITFQRAGVLHQVNGATSASLGTSATIKLAVGTDGSTTDVTGASTAGSAQKINGNTIGPIAFAAGDSLYGIIGGANVTAAANLTVDLLVSHVSPINYVA